MWGPRARGYIVYYTAEGNAVIFDLRATYEGKYEIVYYIVKRTTETPFRTPQLGPTAQFITCYNYTNRTSTIELQYTTITTTYEVCIDYGTTTTTQMTWYTSILYDSFIAPNSAYAPLVILGILALLCVQALSNKKRPK